MFDSQTVQRLFCSQTMITSLTRDSLHWTCTCSNLTRFLVFHSFHLAFLISDVRLVDHCDTDLLVEKLLTLSTSHCPTLAKSWFALAGWCYKWGRKAVDNAVWVNQCSHFEIKSRFHAWCNEVTNKKNREFPYHHHHHHMRLTSVTQLAWYVKHLC